MVVRREISTRSSATLVSMLFLAALAIVQILRADIEWTTSAIINLAILAPCLAVCFVIYLSVLFDRTWYRESRIFRVLMVVEFFLLLSATIFWISKCMHVSDFELSAVYHAESILFSTIIVAFAIYQSTVFRSVSRVADIFDKSIIVVYVLCVAFILINPFTGALFTIEGGSHHAGPLHLLLIVPNTIMVALCMVSTFMHAQTVRMKLLMSSCLLIPSLIILVGYPNTLTVAYSSILVMLIFIYNGVYVDRGLKIVKAESELVERKANLLMSRIEPDFLEQSLESIIDMEGTPNDAKQALDLFKSYLVNNFDTLSHKLPIPITAELDHVRIYTRLEKLRFKDKLDIVFDIRDENFAIPSMTIQMLVENAIKHGITQRKDGGVVVVRTFEADNYHNVVVEDNGIGFDVNAPLSTDKSHVGLENLEARLEEMMSGSFEINSVPGEGTTAIVRIPKY